VCSSDLTSGFFVGFTLFVVLESVKFSNDYIRPLFNLPQDPQSGIVSLKSW